MSAKKQYQELVNRFVTTHRPEVRVSKMYGMSVMTTRGQAFVGLSRNEELVARLDGLEYDRALGLKGAEEYKLSNGQVLPGWVTIPLDHVSHWRGFAEEARLAANEPVRPATVPDEDDPDDEDDYIER